MAAASASLTGTATTTARWNGRMATGPQVAPKTAELMAWLAVSDDPHVRPRRPPAGR